MIPTIIQPALFTSATEYFTVDRPICKLCNGNTQQFQELPNDFATLLFNEIENDEQVKKALLKIGTTTKSEQIIKFYECNYSSYDDTPDVTETGQLGPREYVRCEKRGKCPVEGVLCRRPKGLTSRQLQIASLIALGQMDDQICGDLFISKNTLRKHKNSIEEKIGMTGKPSIAVWAALNILIYK